MTPTVAKIKELGLTIDSSLEQFPNLYLDESQLEELVSKKLVGVTLSSTVSKSGSLGKAEV